MSLTGHPTFVVYTSTSFDENWTNYLKTHLAVNGFFGLPNASGTQCLIQPMVATDGTTLVLVVPDALLSELPNGVLLQHIAGLEEATFHAVLPEGITLDYGVELSPPTTA